MEKYLAATNLNFKATYVYRFNIFIQILIWNLSLIVAIVFWNAAFNEKAIIAGYNKSTMITYVVMVNVVTMFSFRTVCNEIGRIINTGELNRYLVLPQSPLMYFYFKTLGKKVIDFIISIIVLLIFIPYVKVFTNVSFKLENIVIFIIAVMLGSLISYFIGTIIGLAAFFFKNISALNMFAQVIISFLSGFFIPISFFPSAIRNFIKILPFASFGEFPVNILIGNISNDKILKLMIVYIIWVFILAFLSKVLWKMGIKRYEGAGA